MLIRILEINYHDDKDLYDDAIYLGSFRTPHYGEFIRMLNEFKANDEEFHISIGNEWYAVDSYVFDCPKCDEKLPCINVYVI